MEIVFNNNGKIVTSSLLVAQKFGKNHKDVLESIRNLMAENSAANSYFIESVYESRGKTYPMYIMNRDGFSLLVMGFTGKTALDFKIEYINSFNKMEDALKSSQLDFSNPDNVLMIVNNWKQEKERADNLQVENTKLDLKTQFVDKVFESDKNLTLSQAAKLLKLPFGRNTMAKLLREKGIFFKNSNEPKQSYIDRGYFVVFSFVNEAMSRPSTQTFITQKGLAFLAKIFEVIIPKNQIIKIQ